MRDGKVKPFKKGTSSAQRESAEKTLQVKQKGQDRDRTK